MRCHLIACLFVTCLISALSAETYFVNNMSGLDVNSGTVDSIQGDGVGPLRTIAAALRRAKRSDQIVLAATNVPYRECITLQGADNSGYSYAPFVIDGNGATLDGTSEVPADCWEVVREGIYRFEPRRGGFQRLFLDGEPAEEMPRFDQSYISSFLKPKQWCRCRGGIQFAVEKNKVPASYHLSYAQHSVGITLYDVENVIIRDLHVRGYQLDGVNAHDNALDCVLREVSSEFNGRSGFSIGGASRLDLVQCSTKDNGQSEVRTEGWSTTRLKKTKLVAKLQPIWTRETDHYGNGPRLIIDETLQVLKHGWEPQTTPSNSPVSKIPALPSVPTDPFDDDQT